MAVAAVAAGGAQGSLHAVDTARCGPGMTDLQFRPAVPGWRESVQIR
jgi:hypothetical protein